MIEEERKSADVRKRRRMKTSVRERGGDCEGRVKYRIAEAIEEERASIEVKQ